MEKKRETAKLDNLGLLEASLFLDGLRLFRVHGLVWGLGFRCGVWGSGFG